MHESESSASTLFKPDPKCLAQSHRYFYTRRPDGARSDSLVSEVAPRFTNSAAVSESASKAARYKRLIGAKLLKLQRSYFEEFERPLDFGSVAAFERALADLSSGSMPTLTAEPNGRVVATWKFGPESLTLRFVDADTTHFALAASNANGQIKRAWGTADVGELFAENVSARRILKSNSAE